MATVVAQTISSDATPLNIQEGDEPDEFWDALGGKTAYDTEIDQPGAPCLEPRLFHCKLFSNGKFRVEEIHDFEQDDLEPDDIMILDGGDEVYVWEGRGSTPDEKDKSVELANVRTNDSSTDIK